MIFKIDIFDPKMDKRKNTFKIIKHQLMSNI